MANRDAARATLTGHVSQLVLVPATKAALQAQAGPQMV
jgi:hypothetical protein